MSCRKNMFGMWSDYRLKVALFILLSACIALFYQWTETWHIPTILNQIGHFRMPLVGDTDTKKALSEHGMTQTTLSQASTWSTTVSSLTEPDYCSGQVTHPRAKSMAMFDLSRLGPFPFLKDYRNPCWYGQDQQLLCLPYFYLAGFPKCGSTDLYRRIVKHPQVLEMQKETHWITRGRFKEAEKTRKLTIDNYAKKFARPFILNPDSKDYVVGDGSPSTVFDNYLWYMFPGNQNCSEPRIINADYVRHLNPDVKIIVTLRNPTSRLLSEYLFYRSWQKKTKEIFHQEVEREVALFNQCLQERRSLRECVYNKTMEDNKATPGRTSLRIHIGLYHVYIEDWLKRLPRDQFLAIRLDDVSKDAEGVMRRVFEFLELRQPDEKLMKEIVTLPSANANRRKTNFGPMLNATKAILDRFHRPYNERLSKVLRDDRFLWND